MTTVAIGVGLYVATMAVGWCVLDTLYTDGNIHRALRRRGILP